MKATHNKVKETGWKFPCLGVAEDGTIVLFTKPKQGTRLVGSLGVGSYFEVWDMDKFQPLPSTESVTLQND
jgi:hypothetical protein